MGINIKSLAGDEPARFEEIGDTTEGIVASCELVDDQHNPGQQVPVVVVVDDQGHRRKVWLRTGMVTALDAAMTRAGLDELDVGMSLKLTYTDDRPLRSGRVMKVYAAEVTPDPEAF